MGQDQREKKSNGGVFYAQARETAFDVIGQEAVARAGRGPQLKGVIHELGLRELLNLRPKALLGQQRTALTRSSTASTVDLVTTDARGRVIERLQVKDLVSSAGQRDLQQRLAQGQYRSARLVGTEETAAAFNASGHRRTMASSGISSTSTTRAADNAGARVRDRNLLANNVKDIGKVAAGAGVVGAVAGAGTEAWLSYGEYKTGDIDGKEYAGRVARSGAVSAVSTTARTAGALALKEGAKEVAKRIGHEGLKRFAGSNPATTLAFGVVEQGIDTVRLARGDIDGKEYGARTLQTTGATGGAIAGVAAGAALGTAVPVVGNIVGAVVGGFVGGLMGSFGGRRLGDKLIVKK